MRVNNQILSNLKENKEDWYYLCNDAEQALLKVRAACKDERAVSAIEKMILELNSIRMEQYEALTEYSYIDEDTTSYSATIYQIKDVANCKYAFMAYDYVKDDINMNDYEAVASIVLPKKGSIDEVLEQIFVLGNTNKDEFNVQGKFRSISVSDIIEINNELYYVDSLGFKKIN